VDVERLRIKQLGRGLSIELHHLNDRIGDETKEKACVKLVEVAGTVKWQAATDAEFVVMRF
jgi:hypothetical protein